MFFNIFYSVIDDRTVLFTGCEESPDSATDRDAGR